MTESDEVAYALRTRRDLDGYRFSKRMGYGTISKMIVIKNDDPVKSLKTPIQSFPWERESFFGDRFEICPRVPACAGMTTFYENIKNGCCGKKK